MDRADPGSQRSVRREVTNAVKHGRAETHLMKTDRTWPGERGAGHSGSARPGLDGLLETLGRLLGEKRLEPGEERTLCQEGQDRAWVELGLEARVGAPIAEVLEDPGDGEALQITGLSPHVQRAVLLIGQTQVQLDLGEDRIDAGSDERRAAGAVALEDLDRRGLNRPGMLL